MDKPTGREFRISTETWPTEDVILRADAPDGMTFSGYAAVFNSRSEDLGGFRETIAPTAFDKTLKQKRAVKMFWNHNMDIALGSTRANLVLSTDERGLLARATLPDTTAGRDMAVLVRDGIVDSMSFGFQVEEDIDPATGKRWMGGPERQLLDVRLFEVSPVTGWPAYPATSASVRELAEAIEAEPEEFADTIDALRVVLHDPAARLTTEQASLLTSLINARSDRTVRRVLDASEQAMYAAFSAALS